MEKTVHSQGATGPKYAVQVRWDGIDHEPYEMVYIDKYGNRTIYRRVN